MKLKVRAEPFMVFFALPYFYNTNSCWLKIAGIQIECFFVVEEIGKIRLAVLLSLSFFFLDWSFVESTLIQGVFIPKKKCSSKGEST